MKLIIFLRGEKNAENLLIINSKELAKEYLNNWERYKA
jgi:hypothetical protein